MSALGCGLLLASSLAACGSDPAPSDGVSDATTLDSDEGDASVNLDVGTPDAVVDTTNDDPGDDGAGGDTVPLDVAPDAPPDGGDAGEDAVSADADAAADAEVAGDTAVLDIADSGLPPRWASSDPAAAGPYAVTRFTETIETSVQDLDLIIFVPAATDAPYPVVVFNHGFSLTAAAYEAYGQRLASHGFVAILPSVNDGIFAARTHVQLREIQVDVDAWIGEASDTPGTRIFGSAEPELLGVGGHSRGGKQALFAATVDDRIDALFLVDPVDSAPPFGSNPTDYPSVTPELMGGITVPTGYVGSGRGAEATFGQACAPAADNYHAYFTESVSPSYEWVVAGVGHNDFVGTCDFTCQFACPRAEDPSVALDFAIATMVAFYKVYLADDASYQPWLDGDEVATGVSVETR